MAPSSLTPRLAHSSATNFGACPPLLGIFFTSPMVNAARAAAPTYAPTLAGVNSRSSLTGPSVTATLTSPPPRRESSRFCRWRRWRKRPPFDRRTDGGESKNDEDRYRGGRTARAVGASRLNATRNVAGRIRDFIIVDGGLFTSIYGRAWRMVLFMMRMDLSRFIRSFMFRLRDLSSSVVPGLVPRRASLSCSRSCSRQCVRALAGYRYEYVGPVGLLLLFAAIATRPWILMT